MNLLLGSNAQGKTNVLEALFCLSTTRSFRSATDEEMIAFGEESGAIEGAIRRESGEDVFRLEFRRGRSKALFFNGKKQGRLSLLLGRLPAVVFSPDDLFLIKGGPSLRRHMLDVTLVQMDPVYLGQLQKYERALKQRNALLRSRPSDLGAQLAVWDPLLAQHGAGLMRRRAEAVVKLEGYAAKALEDLTGGAEKLGVVYEPSLPLPSDSEEWVQSLLERLKALRREETLRGTTLAGPHRDDIGLSVNGRSLKKFGSQGQQRTAALALKLAQMVWLKDCLGTDPIILFDDVMAELDPKRQAFFLDRLQKGGQAILTGTQAADFASAADKARIFSVEKGMVRMQCEGPRA